MSMSSGGGSGGLQSEINVTPMVDIMLVLLIIFMVVTPFLQQGITVALPKNLNNPDVDPNIIKESSIVISIPNDGEYYLGKQKLAKEQVNGQGRHDAEEHQEGGGSDRLHQERRWRQLRRRCQCHQ